MIWKGRTPDAFRCAVHALKKEIFGFSFDYPLYMNCEKIRKTKIGAIGVPNTSFTEEWKSGGFSPVGRRRRQLSDDKVTRLEGLIGKFLAELGYPLSRAESATPRFRLRTMRAMYPAFYQLKKWLKAATPLGRFVNMNRLHIDQYEDSCDLAEGSVAGESAESLSSTAATRVERNRLESVFQDQHAEPYRALAR